jgi:hypothetical protein
VHVAYPDVFDVLRLLTDFSGASFAADKWERERYLELGRTFVHPENAMEIRKQGCKMLLG